MPLSCSAGNWWSWGERGSAGGGAVGPLGEKRFPDLKLKKNDGVSD